MSTQSNESPSEQKPRPAAWRVKHKFQLQALALILSLAAPFALYWALERGQDGLAAAFFAVLALSMGIAIWAG